MNGTFSHTSPRGTFDKVQLSALMQAMIDGQAIQWRRIAQIEWHTYTTKTNEDKADVIADIMGDPTSVYRAVPRAFLALWNSVADHDGVEFNTALDWWLAGNSAI